MFYLMSEDGKFWLWTDTDKFTHVMRGKLFNSAIMAEAFRPIDVELIRQAAERTFKMKFIPIECNSNKIIPENMRKVFAC